MPLNTIWQQPYHDQVPNNSTKAKPRPSTSTTIRALPASGPNQLPIRRQWPIRVL
ncbi:hypothetical protein Syun_012850 [Stephania yunnanensis]|uniref:Uncharacterized protein n=1 Tax=Stephania yunnanensis TaxID=152371 RepID=A0AAP0K188_9MAGN